MSEGGSAENPLQTFARHLRDLQAQVGSPSLRDLERLTERAGHGYPRATIGDKLTGTSHPDWEFVKTFVTACALPGDVSDEDIKEWKAEHRSLLQAMGASRAGRRRAAKATDQLAADAGVHDDQDNKEPQAAAQAAPTAMPDRHWPVPARGTDSSEDFWPAGRDNALPILPPQRSLVAVESRSRITGELALKEHWDPRGRGVEQSGRPGWFFTGRRHALSHLVAWLTAAPSPADNVRVVTGGPGSGKSAVLARLVTMSDPRYRAAIPAPLASDDPVADLPSGVIDVAVHARPGVPTGAVVSALAFAAGAPHADLDGLIERLLERREAFTITVDALDEADDPRALAMALRQLASQTADVGVRLLVGTRPGGPDRRLITALGLSAREDDPALIDLDTASYLSLHDLTEYVRRRLLLTGLPTTPDQPDTPYRGRETLAGQAAAAIAAAAYPTFLIGQLASRALLLRDQPLSPADPGWQQFPKTVAEAMDQYLASVGSQADQNRVEDLLCPLAYAHGDGLPLDDAGLWPRLATALARPGRSYTLSDVAALLETAADYLVETVITGHARYYRLYHQALSDRLRERDQQHRRPVSAAETVYRCLLDTVALRPDGTRNWPIAHPYLHSQLAGHAADLGQLANLTDDPGFLVAAEPSELFAALQRPSQPHANNAQIYRYAYPHLPAGADTAGQRASYLHLVARRYDAPLADQLRELPLDMPWSARWIRGKRPHPHYIAGRHDSPVYAVAVGELRGRAVIVSSAEWSLRVWDLVSGEPVLKLRTGHGPRPVVAVGERYGRPVIVSGGSDGTVRIWDLESGELVLGPLTHHTLGVSAVAVGERCGRAVIISGGEDGTVRVWDLESGELVLGPLTHHDSAVYAVAVGERRGRPVIISGSFDGTIRVWDLESGEPVLGPLNGHTSAVRAVAVGERYGRPVIISGGEDGTVRVWDLESGEAVLGPLTGHDAWVRAVAVGERYGRPVIISGGEDGTVRVWDLESGEAVLGPLTGHDAWVRAVAVGRRPGAPVIVSGGDDWEVRVWDLESDEPLTSHAREVKAMAVGERRGRPVIISGSYDGSVQVSDLESGEPVLGPFTCDDLWVNAVAVGERCGRPVIISGGQDAAVRVWDLESGESALGPLTSHDFSVEAVAVGERRGRPVIVSGGSEQVMYSDDGQSGSVRVWDLESGEPVLGPLNSFDGWAEAVAIGVRCGRPVVVSGGLGVQVWDLESGERVLSPLTDEDWNGQYRWVRAMAVSEWRGRPVVVSGGDDRMVRVWDLEAERPEILRIELQHQVWSIASAAEGLVIGTSAELLRVDLI